MCRCRYKRNDTAYNKNNNNYKQQQQTNKTRANKQTTTTTKHVSCQMKNAPKKILHKCTEYNTNTTH